MSDIFGHVYVIQGHKGVKIGMSTNPTKRVAILKRGMGIADAIANGFLNDDLDSRDSKA